MKYYVVTIQMKAIVVLSIILQKVVLTFEFARGRNVTFKTIAFEQYNVARCF